MSQDDFRRAYWNFGRESAVWAALFLGVTRAQVDLWLLSPTLKPSHWTGGR